jgi:serine/threonine protein kinase
MKDYKYVIIMPAADRSLDAIYTSELPDEDHVRMMMKEVAESLLNCHKKGIIHCDLKMLNIVRVNGRMKLIDFDAACEIDSFACSKFSSSILPPEMFCELVSEEEERKVEQYWSSITDAAMIDLRRKVEPKKSGSGVYCVKAYYSGAGPSLKDLPYELVRATPQLDIWSFGVVLYMLCAREFPLSVSRDGDLVGPLDMKTVATWKQADIQLLICQKFKSDPVLADLLLKLLHPDPGKRLQSVCEVLLHPYFMLPINRHVNGDLIKEMNDRTKRIEEDGKKNLQLSLEIKKITTEVNRISIKTLSQIRRTERVLLRGQFEAADVTVPSSFVIVNTILQPSNPINSSVPSTSSTSAPHRFLEKLCKVGMAILPGPESLTDAMTELLIDEKFYLYLLDERTMMPVVVEGDKVYPIKITTPAEFVPKMLPLMKVGLKAAAALNGVSGIARLLGYPLPCIPEEYMEMANKAVGKFDNKSSVAEFDTIQSCLDSKPQENGSNGERANESARGAPLRELARFLLQHDPKRTYSGLRRVATPLGDCCWTTDEGVAAIRDSAKLEDDELWEAEVPPDTLPVQIVTVVENHNPSAVITSENVTTDSTILPIQEENVAEKLEPSAVISSERVTPEQIPHEKLMVKEKKKVLGFFFKKNK